MFREVDLGLTASAGIFAQGMLLQGSLNPANGTCIEACVTSRAEYSVRDESLYAERSLSVPAPPVSSQKTMFVGTGPLIQLTFSMSGNDQVLSK